MDFSRDTLRRQLIDHGWDGDEPAIVVTGQTQRLHLLPAAEKKVLSWLISTGSAGFGTKDGSGMTPTGLHRIAARIGEGEPLGMVFKGREATGEQLKIGTPPPPGDWITTRILRLEGCQPGHNQGSGCDSFERYIYIHGTPHTGSLGRPDSHGCIRMADEDVCELFDRVHVGTPVLVLDRIAKPVV
ncbi:MAG: L,D-transpeptidase [Magnetococcales bacterium]|nr:L,D-transpeptidase [Magnetococcales bacterium]